MASSLSTMKGMYGRGLGAWFGGTVAGFGSSVLLGTLYGKYREKWYGQWMPVFFAVGGKLAALGVFLGTKGHGLVSTALLNDVGQAGVNALGLDLGVKAGLKWDKKELAVVPAGAALPAGAHRIAGDLPPAQVGRGLRDITVEELANMR